jgi:hypothetical protein
MSSQQVFYVTRQQRVTEWYWYRASPPRVRWKFRLLLWGFLSFIVWLNGGGLSVAQQLEWAKQAGGTNGDQSNNIAADEEGNTYVIGSFANTATFGPGEANETVLTSAGSADLFVAK